jgi:hypothetical protein
MASTSGMSSKYCSACIKKLPLSSFLASTSADLGGKVFGTCIPCQDQYKKRKALQPLDPNIQAKRRVPKPTKAPTRLEATIPPPNPLKSRPEATIPPPNPPKSRLETPICVPTPPLVQPQALGFLPANQWASIQSFNKAIAAVEIETCI